MENADLPKGYRYIRQCGAGTFGDVWLVRDLAQRLLVLKIIPKQPNFHHELEGVRAFCRLNSPNPNLIRIYHTGEDERCFFYTMQAADNLNQSEADYLPKTLENLLRLKKLSPAETRAISLAILAGLDTLHQAGLVHRDVKPANIFFMSGVACLGDIGLVSGDGDAASLMGTRQFLPPELLELGGDQLYGSAYLPEYDLYALGKVMYCMLTGLDAANFPILPAEDCTDPLFAPLNKITQRLCAPEPARRIKNRAELRRLLHAAGNRRTAFIKRLGLFGIPLALLLATSIVLAVRDCSKVPAKPPVAIPVKPPQPVAPAPVPALGEWRKALTQSSPEALQRLLKSGVAPDTIPEGWSQTPLFYCIREGKPLEFMKLLLDAGAAFAPPDEPRDALATALVLHLPEPEIQFFISRSPNISRPNELQQRTALFDAVKRQNTDILRLLIQAGIKIDHQDIFGQTALFKSIQHGWSKSALFLLQHGADPALPDQRGANALHVAGAGKSLPVLCALLAKGMDVNSVMLHNTTPLLCAVRNLADDAIIRQLIKAGARLDVADCAGITPLHEAISGNATDTMKLLLESGANPNVADRVGLTPLHYAAIYNRPAALELLAAAKVPIDAHDRYGRTPLQFAWLNGNDAVAKRLIELRAAFPKTGIQLKNGQLYGANGKSRQSLPPPDSPTAPAAPIKGGLQHCCSRELFHSAIALNRFSLAERLVSERRVAGNAVNFRWASALETALMERAENRYYKLLLAAGANPALPLFNGWTPLMVAVEEYHLPLAKMLLDHGADPTQPAAGTRINAVSLARDTENQDMLRLFDFYCNKVCTASHRP